MSTGLMSTGAMPRESRRRESKRTGSMPTESGWTAVEICLVISIAGLLLAVMIPAFVRAFHASKVSEAALQLAEIHGRVATYYGSARTINNAEGTGRAGQHCLPNPAGPTPYKLARRAREINFGHADARGRDTWQAIDFLPEEPLRFRYTFVPEAAGCRGKDSAHEGRETADGRLRGGGDGDEQRSGFEPGEDLKREAGEKPDAKGPPETPQETSDGIPRGFLLRAEGDLDGDGMYSLFERRARVDGEGQVEAVGILHQWQPVE